MLFSGGPIGSRQLGFAWSTDGLNWIQYPENPIVSPTPGTWDSKEVFWASSVIKVATDTYWAYYQGIDTNGGSTFWCDVLDNSRNNNNKPNAVCWESDNRR